MDDKGQMHTLEGAMASIIMLVVVVFVVQGTTLTPLSSSSTNQHVQLELENFGSDLLSSLDYTKNPLSNSSLKNSILAWNGLEYVWDGSRYVDVENYDTTMDTDLTKALNFTLNRWGVAYNIEIVYVDNNGMTTKAMIWNGNPSDNSICVSKMIALHDVDIIGRPQFKSGTMIPDLDPESDFYNLVDVRLTLWRM